jgi:hypothetical protein
MIFGNTEIRYHIDYLQKKIHLLDLKERGTKLLINEISPQYQEELVKHEQLLQDVLNFDWYCYLQDGLILLYNDYNTKFVSAKLPYLYSPFVEIMKERRVK